MTIPKDLVPLLDKLKLFDPPWYLAHNEDVRKSGENPWKHFVREGFDQGRQPGPRFSPELYLKANPKLNPERVHPLQHYLRHGHRWNLPLTPEETEFREQIGSRWPQSPLPVNLPDWYGTKPGAAPEGTLRVMYALSVQAGGTPQTNQDLMAAMGEYQNPTVEPFVLRCFGNIMVLYLFNEGIYVPLAHHRLNAPVQPFPHRSEECDRVAGQWLSDFGIQVVHIRHSAWQSLGLIDSAAALGVPVVYSFHDYYAVCPSVKLLDENWQFCGGRCTTGRGDCFQEIWDDASVKPLKHHSVYDWQLQFAGALALCSAFVTTSPSAKALLLDIYPTLADKPFPVIAHGRDFGRPLQLAQQPKAGEVVRVVVPGHITRQKGGEIILALAAMPELKQVEWHILGTVNPDLQARFPETVITHGYYHRDEFAARLQDIQPHLGAVLSIWPETWCHTLTELWAAGLPVLGFDTGAVGERMKNTGAGWLAAGISASQMADTLQSAMLPDTWNNAVENVLKWQRESQTSRAQMAEAYLTLYSDIT